jgi:hypothetical protein
LLLTWSGIATIASAFSLRFPAWGPAPPNNIAAAASSFLRFAYLV